MMSLNGPTGPIDHAGLDHKQPLPPHAIWIDLDDPSAEEAQLIEETTGIRVPSRAALSEVETSSRLRRLKGGGLSLSTPMITFSRLDPSMKPLGLVLTKDRLVTIRFHDLRAFAAVHKRIEERDGDCATSFEIFLLLIEELVDNIADTLEDMSADLDTLSSRIFEFGVNDKPALAKEDGRAPKRRDRALRRLLWTIGRQGKALTKIRASLLGLERIMPFVRDNCPQALGLEPDPRLDTLARDIASLDEFETRQSETLQFLLDATLGLINIEQNNAFRILTVVSVVGIPPTLVASIYGMNFDNMPELHWAWGYPFGLLVIGLTAVLPALIFRWRGWI